MKNIISYLKDKIYYIMGATVLLIIILIAISACSKGGKSYSSIEASMVSAAKSYYSSRDSKLPKEENVSVKVTVGTLIDSGLLDEIKDPNDKEKTCDGYVLVKKVGEQYVYTPFLTCEGNYEPEYLADKIKNSTQDEYGNGVYVMGNEYVYRGDDVKNYVSFANKTWRIIEVDEQGDIKLILSKHTDEFYIFDDSYNSDVQKKYGIITDYLKTDIRKSLVKYYDEQFDSESKAKIVSKNLCIGSYQITDQFSAEQECTNTINGEKIGLPIVSDYQKASLSEGCTNLDSKECTNYNYLNDFVSSWLLNSVGGTSYKMFYLSGAIFYLPANYRKPINPVIYISGDVVTLKGTGTKEEPYIVK